jgi:hypothetical protein
MSTLDDLQHQLGEAQALAEKTMAELENYGSIKSSLESGNRSLSESASILDELAGKLKPGVEGLSRTALSTREAIDLIKEINPGEIARGLERIESRLGDLSVKSDKAGEAIGLSETKVLTSVENSVTGAEETLAAAIARISRNQAIIFALLAINLAGVVLLLSWTR